MGALEFLNEVQSETVCAPLDLPILSGLRRPQMMIELVENDKRLCKQLAPREIDTLLLFNVASYNLPVSLDGPNPQIRHFNSIELRE